MNQNSFCITYPEVTSHFSYATPYTYAAKIKDYGSKNNFIISKKNPRNLIAQKGQAKFVNTITARSNTSSESSQR